MSNAWVRGISATFDQAIIGQGGRVPDVTLARDQHRDYTSRLEASGLNVTQVAIDNAYPDCVFIEDTAVILDDVVLATRPGAVPRRGEVEVVVAELSKHFPIREVESPGTIDGGDVMVVGDRVFVGRSKRTNKSGIEQLTAVAAEIGLETIALDVIGVLHLKSAVLPIDNETVVVTPGSVDEGLLTDLRIVHEDRGESHRFSALPLADRVLVTDAAPITVAELERLGVPVDPIDVSEILAADGGLTCMSIIDRR